MFLGYYFLYDQNLRAILNPNEEETSLKRDEIRARVQAIPNYVLRVSNPLSTHPVA